MRHGQCNGSFSTCCHVVGSTFSGHWRCGFSITFHVVWAHGALSPSTFFSLNFEAGFFLPSRL